VHAVAGDTFQNGPESRPISVIYYSVHQKEWDALVLMVRTESDPVAMEAAIGDQIHRIDKTIHRTEPATVEQQLWELESDRRFQIELFTLFSFFAIVLAGVGMYAAMAHLVGQRTREIGIRMALGARRMDVLLMILRQGLLPVVLGWSLADALAFAFSRTLVGLLDGVTSTDPITHSECVCAPVQHRRHSCLGTVHPILPYFSRVGRNPLVWNSSVKPKGLVC
jgi:putative ABC transport system permease protein